MFSLINIFFENRCFLSRVSSISPFASSSFESLSLASVLSSDFFDLSFFNLSFLESDFFDSASDVDSSCALLSDDSIDSVLSDGSVDAVLSCGSIVALSSSTGNSWSSFLPVKVSVICLQSSRLSALPSIVNICEPSFSTHLPLPIFPTLLYIN